MTTDSDEPLDLGEIEPGAMTHWESRGTSTQHVFVGDRCIYCNVNSLDIGIYLSEDHPCVEHPLAVYTTESP